MDCVIHHVEPVTEPWSGERLDTFLTSFPYTKFDEFLAPSRSQIQKWIVDGFVMVNDMVAVNKSRKMKVGDNVKLDVVIKRELETPPPENLDIEIVYEDEEIIVLNKPPGINSHPSYNAMTGSVVNFLYYKNVRIPIGAHPLRPGIVHRLDKNTSGLMVVTKTSRSLATLMEMIKRREVERIYIAIVFGEIPTDSGTIEARIGRHDTDRKKMAVQVAEHRSRAARTHYRVLERYTGFTYIACKLDTGRTHQIRVHMSHIGYPVAGDLLYGGRKAQDRIENKLKDMSKKKAGYQETERILHKVSGLITSDDVHLLHAAKLSFPHPLTREPLSFKAPPHKKFMDALVLLQELPDREVVDAF
jgi:23S rRNA pseudouridine1911/1915/1917 synthase